MNIYNAHYHVFNKHCQPVGLLLSRKLYQGYIINNYYSKMKNLFKVTFAVAAISLATSCASKTEEAAPAADTAAAAVEATPAADTAAAATTDSAAATTEAAPAEAKAEEHK